MKVNIKKIGGVFTKPKVFIIGVLLGALVVTVFLWRPFAPKAKAGQVDQSITPSVVFERVKAEGKLVCASQNYSIVEKAGSSNKIPFTDIPIPFTDNSYWYRYNGTIQVAVDLGTAEPDKKHTKGKAIALVLDPPFIDSNTPDMDTSGVLEERNNVLNPIHVEDIDAFQRQCQEQSQKDALKGTIMDEARENAEDRLSMLFRTALGDDYTVTVSYREAKSK